MGYNENENFNNQFLTFQSDYAYLYYEGDAFFKNLPSFLRKTNRNGTKSSINSCENLNSQCSLIENKNYQMFLADNLLMIYFFFLQRKQGLKVRVCFIINLFPFLAQETKPKTKPKVKLFYFLFAIHSLIKYLKRGRLSLLAKVIFLELNIIVFNHLCYLSNQTMKNGWPITFYK